MRVETVPGRGLVCVVTSVRASQSLFEPSGTWLSASLSAWGWGPPAAPCVASPPAASCVATLPAASCVASPPAASCIASHWMRYVIVAAVSHCPGTTTRVLLPLFQSTRRAHQLILEFSVQQPICNKTSPLLLSAEARLCASVATRGLSWLAHLVHSFVAWCHRPSCAAHLHEFTCGRGGA